MCHDTILASARQAWMQNVWLTQGYAGCGALYNQEACAQASQWAV